MMPKRKRAQKRDGGAPNSPDSLDPDEERPPSEPNESRESATDDDLSGDEGPEAEDDESVSATQRRKKSLRGFLKQVKGQHYRVVEMRVALVCSFGVFAKVMFSDVLVEDEDSFVTHAALTFAACKYVPVYTKTTGSPYTLRTF